MKSLLPFVLVVLAGCAPKPPAHWAGGGAEVDIPFARWVRGDVAVEIHPDGKVKVNGEHEATLDRAGRLFDGDGQPIALLEPDGHVTGPDDAPLGFVGQNSASLPGMATAWIVIRPSGEVLRFDDDGAPTPMGVWTGQCGATPRTTQVCTLITHLMAAKQRSGPRFGISIGVGVGIGVGGRR
ncbi:MAG: hypothetical protein QM820_51310 [Minicystis sp.]